MRDRAKVMLFSHLSDPSRLTGAEKWLLYLARMLSSRYDILLVAPRDGMLTTEAAAAGIQTKQIDYPLLWTLYEGQPSMHADLQAQLASEAYRRVMDAIHLFRPDWIVVNTAVTMLPAAAARAAGIPVAWVVNELLLEGGAKQEAIRLVEQHARWLVGISSAVLASYAPVRQLPTSLLFPSWNDHELVPTQWEEQRKAVHAALGIEQGTVVVGLAAAMLSANKGVDHFIQMAALLQRQYPFARFLIAGSQELRDFVQRCRLLAAAAPEPRNIIFHPFEARMDRLYPAMDMIVVPSVLDEGFGMTALEGLAFAKPVVAYKSGGLQEVLTLTGNGHWLVDKGDTRALADKVGELLRQRDTLQELGAFNRQAALNVFGESAFAQRLSGWLGQVDEQLKLHEGQWEQGRSAHADGTLVRSPSAPTVYLLENRNKRPFSSEQAFAYYRFNVSDVIEVEDAVLHSFPTGEELSLAEPFERFSPQRMLLRGSGRTIYLREGMQVRPFRSMRALQLAGYSRSRIVRVPDHVLARFERGPAIGSGSRGAGDGNFRGRVRRLRRRGDARRSRKLANVRRSNVQGRRALRGGRANRARAGAGRVRRSGRAGRSPIRLTRKRRKTG